MIYKIELSVDKKTVNVINARTGALLESLVARSYMFGDSDDSETKQQIERLNNLYNN